ncbi:hypothetical protein Ancab_032637 [Ancistrocladus abbreviatus]
MATMSMPNAYSFAPPNTEYGDIYDCVDFYKQPAFNHPLLKNHTFHPQMRPTFTPKRVRTEGLPGMNKIDLDMIKLKDGGCPVGTVPIRRISKDSQHFSRGANINAIQRPPGTIFAIAQTKYNAGIRSYYGVGATISIYNPHVRANQFTSAEIMIQSGPDMIEVGWTVNPGVYRDNYTRFFIYTIASGSHCFGSQCGFISVRKDIPVDFPMSPISKRGGPIYVFQYLVYQDPNNGNWWLEIGEPSITLGFWPKRFFTTLAQSGSYVACGAEAFTPPGQPASGLEIGSGYTLYFKDPKWDAFCKNFVIVNEAHNIVDADGTESFASNKNYDVKDAGVHKRLGHIVFFGGPKLP